jgi:hypothetical protein
MPRSSRPVEHGSECIGGGISRVARCHYRLRERASCPWQKQPRRNPHGSRGGWSRVHQSQRRKAAEPNLICPFTFFSQFKKAKAPFSSSLNGRTCLPIVLNDEFRFSGLRDGFVESIHKCMTKPHYLVTNAALDKLPLFASDLEIAIAIVGKAERVVLEKDHASCA